jgi:TolB-like protein
MRADLESLSRRLETRAPKPRTALAIGLVLALLALAGLLVLRNTRIRSWAFGPASAGGVRELSLAVLPLENLTGDSSQEYFVDGMTDALITNLTKLGSLRVISRTSAMHYKGTHKTVPEIARELNVRAVVVGSVTRSGDRVRIRAQLADAGTGENLWARDYERNLEDVLELQNELAEAVTQEVAGRLTPHRLAESRPVNPQAYEDYLRGRYFESNFRTKEGLQKAEQYLTRAIQEDPNYAPSFIVLSKVYQRAGWSLVDWMDPREAGPKAVAAAQKAVELDGNLAEAHLTLADAKRIYAGKVADDAARKEVERAFELSPNDINVLFARAELLNDRELSCKYARAAHQMDPLNLDASIPFMDCLFNEQKYDEAIAEARKAVELYPRNPGLRDLLSGFYQRRGRYPEAIAEIEQYRTLGGLCPEQALIHALGLAGRRQEAERRLNKLRNGPDWDDWCGAIAYVGLGRYDEAIRALDRGTAKGGGDPDGMRVTGWRWEFEPLRSDPRFQALLKRGEEPY